MRAFLKVLAMIVLVACAAVFVAAIASPALLPVLAPEDAPVDSAGPNGPAETITGDAYPGDPATEPAFVAAEQSRLAEVSRAAASVAGRAEPIDVPYRVLTPGRATLVLPDREEPYELAELAELAPDSVSESQPGVFIAAEHIAIPAGASLLIASGERLRLASDGTGFSSLVVMGGALEISGGQSRPVIESWDAAVGAADNKTADGRSYIRINGGTASIAGADLNGLGFWSGETGGLAFTGRADPVPEAAEDALAPPEDSADVPSIVPDAADPAALLTTGELSDVSITGNAFGVFAEHVAGFTLANSRIGQSLVDGIVLHAGMQNATVTNTTTSENGMDGLVVRASDAVKVQGLTAAGNGRNGVTIDGRPLAGSANAAGSAVGAFGNEAIVASALTGNARYGIEVHGGERVRVSDTTIDGGLRGVVLDSAPDQVTLEQNTLRGQSLHGVAVLDDATQIEVRGNAISDQQIGIYVRNADAGVADNRITGAEQHGVQLVGNLSGSPVHGNDVSGTGSMAIDSERAIRASVEDNLVEGWVESQSLADVVQGILQPLTLLWAGVLALVSIAVIRGVGRKERIRQRAPLQSLSRGVFDRSQAEVFR